MSDIEAQDFFWDDELVKDPYPYLADLRSKCPVHREPHHDVVMVTGYDEALAVLGDAATFSSCMSVTGPFPGFPVPLEGDDVTEFIAAHRDAIPMSDQIITLDPPTHTDHRAPADGADHAEASQGERGVHVGVGRPRPGFLPHRRPR
jgi:cytochrome P450 family 150 subfamily A5